MSERPAAHAQALSAYRQGLGIDKSMKIARVGPKVFSRMLIEDGQKIRTRAESNYAKAIAQHRHPLREISADRWKEIYWGHDLPSLGALQKWASGYCGWKVGTKTIVSILKGHGIKVRTSAEQLGIDGNKGRRAQYVNFPRWDEMTFEKQEEIRQQISQKLSGKRKTAEHKRKLGLAHRRDEMRLCWWCGKEIVRRPSEFHGARTYCSRSHSAAGTAWFRRFPDLPRPIIADKLRAMIQSDPNRPTWGRAQHLGESIGAGEAEIESAFYGNRVDA